MSPALPEEVPGADTESVRVRIDVAYDGTGFAGWARQPDLPTVQQEIEDALASICGEPIDVFCAGRTDAGVHARGQVVHTDLPRSAFDRRTLYGLLAQLNHQTDPQVLCRIAAWAPPFFDARFSALSRHYVYRICDDALLVDPLTQRWVTYHPRRLSASAMAQAAQHLVGKHDFAAFCRRKARATTIREVLYLDVSRDAAQRVEIRIGADAFCHSMVRSLVGGLVAVGEGRRSPKWLAEVLESRSRDSAAGVMAAHGLVLERVDYPPAELMEQRNRKSRQLRTM